MTEDTRGVHTDEDTPEKPAEGNPELMAKLNAGLKDQGKKTDGEQKTKSDPPPSSRQAEDNAEFDRLAALSDSDYDREREPSAEKLGIRVTTLDREVNKRRPKAESTKLQGQAIAVDDREPWPEEVEGATLLDEIVRTIRRYIVLKDSEAVTIALWLVASYAFMEFFIFPRLRIKSPVPGCGKSTLLDILECLVNRPHKVDNGTVSTLFRVIEQYRPTQLLDETDAWLKDDTSGEKRGIINAGHKKNGAVERCVGEDQEVRWFFVYCPMILVGIGKLAGTIEDRSVSVLLQKKKPGQKVERFRGDRPSKAITDLARKICRFAQDHAAELGNADPAIPESVSNRTADNWRPLLAVADAAGGEWPKKAREVAASVSGDADFGEAEARLAVLSDIKVIFDDEDDPKIKERTNKDGTTVKSVHSQVLVDTLVKLEGTRWSEFNRGKALTQTGLAHLLSDYAIRPYQMRIGTENKKGYDVPDFDDAFASYLANSEKEGDQTETTKQSNKISEIQPNQTETMETTVSVQNADKPLTENDCFVVSVCDPPPGDIERKGAEEAPAGTASSVLSIRIIGQGGSCDFCGCEGDDIFTYAPGGGRKAEARCPEHAKAWGAELGQPVDPIPEPQSKPAPAAAPVSQAGDDLKTMRDALRKAGKPDAVVDAMTQRQVEVAVSQLSAEFGLTWEERRYLIEHGWDQAMLRSTKTCDALDAIHKSGGVKPRTVPPPSNGNKHPKPDWAKDQLRW
jgi:hypothetical protein